MNSNEPNKVLLEKEYFQLQKEIGNFDAKSLTIKAWSVSLAGAIAGTSAFTSNKKVILFAALISLMFWFIDGTWKTFQRANYPRIREIEKFMRGEIKEIHCLQISSSWKTSYKKDRIKQLLKKMFWPHVILPHGAMFIILVLFYSLSA